MTYHVGIDVRGALTNWTAREAKACHKPDGTPMTLREVRAALMDELEQGHTMIPFGKPCDNWDWKEGCKGHPEAPNA